jgi:DNA-binding NarL/FixJ family response regulator
METTRVVIADDHEVVRDGIAHTLKDLPNLEIVGEVGDGPALFSILAQAQPDCLILDVAMPDFEPIGAIRLIRAHYPNLRILVVSAYDDDAYVQGMLSAGVQGYHLKDQSLSDLKLAVQRVLAGERWVCSPLVSKLLHPSEGVGFATQLTARQRELLRCLQQGLDNQSIAHRTGLSVKTVENHLTHLYRQLHVASRLEAVNYIAEHPEVLAGSPPGSIHSIAGVTSPARTRVDILIVDDNMRYRTQLRRMIGKAAPQGQVYEADNTLTALRLTEEVRPQLALVDVVLGEENGIECLRRLRELSISTRVILMSAYPDRAFHQLGLEAGAIAFLDKKDMNTAALRELIDDAVG